MDKMRSGERGLSQVATVFIIIGIIIAVVVPTIVAVILLSGPQDLGDFKVVYGAVATPEYAEFEQAFRQSQMFELIASELNDTLVMLRHHDSSR